MIGEVNKRRKRGFTYMKHIALHSTQSLKFKKFQKSMLNKWSHILNYLLEPYKLHYINGTMVNYQVLSDSLNELSLNESCLLSTIQTKSKQIMIWEGLEWYRYKIFDNKSKKTVLNNIKKTAGYVAFEQKLNSMGYDVNLLFYQDSTSVLTCLKINFLPKDNIN